MSQLSDIFLVKTGENSYEFGLVVKCNKYDFQKHSTRYMNSKHNAVPLSDIITTTIKEPAEYIDEIMCHLKQDVELIPFFLWNYLSSSSPSLWFKLQI